MANNVFVPKINPDYRKDELGIIVGRGGRHWLVVVEELSWRENGHRHKSKLDCLLRLGKLIPFGSWQEVLVDITWDNDSKEFVVKRQYCVPYYFKREVVYAYVP